MKVENYHVIAIATLGDWLKKSHANISTKVKLQNLAPTLQPLIRRKSKTNRILWAQFSLLFDQVTGNC